MSKGKNAIKDKKKAPSPEAGKKTSSYQTDKTSVSKSDTAIGKKSK
jgi:hypothetical protein